MTHLPLEPEEAFCQSRKKKRKLRKLCITQCAVTNKAFTRFMSHPSNFCTQAKDFEDRPRFRLLRAMHSAAGRMQRSWYIECAGTHADTASRATTLYCHQSFAARSSCTVDAQTCERTHQSSQTWLDHWLYRSSCWRSWLQVQLTVTALYGSVV